MIDGKNFKIYEPDDVVEACNNIEEAGGAIANILREIDKDGLGEKDALDFLGNLYTVLAAAGVGAAVCKQQGGLVLIKEGCTEEEHREAVKALEELRQKMARPATTAFGQPLPQ